MVNTTNALLFMQHDTRIPNKEVHTFFKDQIRVWFERHAREGFNGTAMYQAMRKSNSDGAASFQSSLKTKILLAISYYDTLEGVVKAEFRAGYVVVSFRTFWGVHFNGIRCDSPNH